MLFIEEFSFSNSILFSLINFESFICEIPKMVNVSKKRRNEAGIFERILFISN